ncbi:MAG TPA: hypothetical protein VF228_21690 [Iamia sp.]
MRHVGGRTQSKGREEAEAGETLIEILVTLILMGTAVIGILAGIASVLHLSDINSRRTHVGNTAQTFAEQIKQPVLDMVYKPCATVPVSPTAPATTTTYPPFSGTLPGSAGTYTARVTNVAYINVISASGGTNTWTSSCTPTAAGTDRGLQRLTIQVEVTIGGGTTTETLSVVKRDARCNVQYSSLYVNTNQGPC